MNEVSAKTVLQANFLFRDLSPDLLDKVASLAARRSYKKGAVVFMQGDSGDALYSVAAGKVRISASAPDGTEVFLNIMESGDTFGEIALLDGEARTATATTMQESHLLVIPRTQFMRLLETEPLLAVHLLKLFCERVRWTSEMVEDTAFLSVRARLAKRLLSLAEQHGSDTASGVELKLSQSELGLFLSISRQVVNQYLQEWAKTGIVELHRGAIVLCDREALQDALGNS
jgi:CRP/FNR family cyclic AMP-dependent transcriptional regulator